MPKYIVTQPIWLDGERIEPGTADEPKIIELDEGRAAIPVRRGLLAPSPETEQKTGNGEPETRPSRRKSSNS